MVNGSQILLNNDVDENEKKSNHDEIQYVAFKLDNEEYAVEILSVQEIIRWTGITRVPKAPPFVKGVINLRGAVIPVIDSHVRLNLPEAKVTDSTRIIIFKLDDIIVGMTIDNVTEVLKLSSHNIEQPQTVNNSENQYIWGIGKIDSRLLIIMDLHKVLFESGTREI